MSIEGGHWRKLAAGRIRSAPQFQLLRVLGAGFGVAVCVGNSIGAGIMRTPGENAARLPNSILIMAAWIAGAIYSLVGAWALSEIGAMMPDSGGYYPIARRAFSDYIGFMVGWTDWLGQCGSIAAVSILLSETVSSASMSYWAKVGIASGWVGILAVLQLLGVSWSGRIQNLTSSIIAAAFIFLISAAFVLPGSAPIPANVSVAMPTGTALIVNWFLVLQAVIYTFDGWYGAIYFGDEIVDPGVEIPRSLVGGVILLSLIYVATNAALLRIFGPLSLGSQELPIVALGNSLFGSKGGIIARSLMLISLSSIANVGLLCGARVLFAMGRDGWGLPRTVRVSRGGTPYVALLGTAAATIIFISSGSFAQILGITAFTFVAKYTISYTAVFVLRKKLPNAERPFRAWGYPWTTGFAVIASILFLIAALLGDMRNSVYSLILLALSYPVFQLAGRIHKVNQ